MTTEAELLRAVSEYQDASEDIVSASIANGWTLESSLAILSDLGADEYALRAFRAMWEVHVVE